MWERENAVTFKGKPLTLLGDELEVGDNAPDCALLGNNLSEVKLSDYRGKICIISSVPSLDTGVCDVQTRRFNEEAAQLGSDVVILTISMDLPFAQERWCGGLKVPRVVTLSDHKEGTFGFAYGLLIKELRLLARCVMVADQKGVIRYLQLAQELTQEPNYEAALQAVKELKK